MSQALRSTTPILESINPYLWNSHILPSQNSGLDPHITVDSPTDEPTAKSDRQRRVAVEVQLAIGQGVRNLEPSIHD